MARNASDKKQLANRLLSVLSLALSYADVSYRYVVATVLRERKIDNNDVTFCQRLLMCSIGNACCSQ